MSWCQSGRVVGDDGSCGVGHVFNALLGNLAQGYKSCRESAGKKATGETRQNADNQTTPAAATAASPDGVNRRRCPGTLAKLTGRRSVLALPAMVSASGWNSCPGISKPYMLQRDAPRRFNKRVLQGLVWLVRSVNALLLTQGRLGRLDNAS
jgi:hypothetical protein